MGRVVWLKHGSPSSLPIHLRLPCLSLSPPLSQTHSFSVPVPIALTRFQEADKVGRVGGHHHVRQALGADLQRDDCFNLVIRSYYTSQTGAILLQETPSGSPFMVIFGPQKNFKKASW